MVNYIRVLLIMGIALCWGCTHNNNERKKEQHNVPVKEQTITVTSDSAYICISPKKYKIGTVNKVKKTALDIQYEIENIGKAPLILTKVDVSCNCLSVNYSQEPILPGNKSLLKVHIDLKNQKGTMNKVIYINSNAENNLILARVIGEIIE